MFVGRVDSKIWTVSAFIQQDQREPYECARRREEMKMRSFVERLLEMVGAGVVVDMTVGGECECVCVLLNM